MVGPFKGPQPVSLASLAYRETDKQLKQVERGQRGFGKEGNSLREVFPPFEGSHSTILAAAVERRPLMGRPYLGIFFAAALLR